MSYYQKYIKYKQKYLMTKQTMSGGAKNITIDGNKYVCDGTVNDNELTDYNYYQIPKDKFNFNTTNMELLKDPTKTQLKDAVKCIAVNPKNTIYGVTFTEIHSESTSTYFKNYFEKKQYNYKLFNYKNMDESIETDNIQGLIFTGHCESGNDFFTDDYGDMHQINDVITKLLIKFNNKFPSKILFYNCLSGHSDESLCKQFLTNSKLQKYDITAYCFEIKVNRAYDIEEFEKKKYNQIIFSKKKSSKITRTIDNESKNINTILNIFTHNEAT
jgi:hypothetical protein